MTNLSVLNSLLVIIIIIIIIMLFIFFIICNVFLFTHLILSGNFGNFIDGAAPPTSKKKGEKSPDPFGQDVAMTLPLLEVQPLKPCKSTTAPEKPVIGDGVRCSTCSSFLCQFPQCISLQFYYLVCAGTTSIYPTQIRNHASMCGAPGRTGHTVSTILMYWTGLLLCL